MRRAPPQSPGMAAFGWGGRGALRGLCADCGGGVIINNNNIIIMKSFLFFKTVSIIHQPRSHPPA